MIRLEAVTKSYADGTVAVRDLTLDVAEGEIACLVGPSGCGKTTTMRIINRLIEPTSGAIVIDGEDVTSIDPVELRRRIGYVIQQVGLFPHQTVAANIATVPKLLGWDKARIDARVEELLRLIGLESAQFAKRYPAELSGGQRQRVGVARALAADPPVLLMDEPFGAVDPLARDRLQDQFLELQQTVRKTIVFVTHDIDEAIKLGDRIAVMRNGALEQFADPATLVADPVNEFVADFVGSQRSLRRLRVSAIDPARLQRWPVIAPDASAAETRAAGDGVVVAVGSNVTGVITGRLPNGLGAAAAAAAVATVEITEPLEAAMAALLAQADADAPGVVVVTDGDSVAGVLTLDELVATARTR